MGSLPTGSDKLLEIQSGNIYVVIKSKNPHPNLTNPSILQQASELRVTGVDVNSVRLFGEEKIAAGNGVVGASFYSIPTSPLFLSRRITKLSSEAGTENKYLCGTRITVSEIESVPSQILMI